jgi:hypothetical protein
VGMRTGREILACRRGASPVLRYTAALLVLALAMGAKSCATMHVAATAGGPSVAVWEGHNPPAETKGAWLKSGGAWHLIPFTALAYGTGHEMKIAMTEGQNEPESIMTIHSDLMTNNFPCNGLPDHHMLVTWLTNKGEVKFDCSSYRGLRKYAQPRTAWLIGCITRFLTSATDHVEVWDSFYGSRISIWRLGPTGELVTKDGFIEAVQLPINMSWMGCAEGTPL